MNATYGESQSMSGKKGASGRPSGALSWHQHPTARCGHQLNVLIELWLALAPERRFTVPPKDKRVLAERAIRQVLLNEIESPEVVVVDVDDVLAWSRRHNTAATVEGGPTLRRVRRSRNDDSFNPATGFHIGAAEMDGSANVGFSGVASVIVTATAEMDGRGSMLAVRAGVPLPPHGIPN
jgi:hypothetical protein